MSSFFSQKHLPKSEFQQKIQEAANRHQNTVNSIYVNTYKEIHLNRLFFSKINIIFFAELHEIVILYPYRGAIVQDSYNQRSYCADMSSLLTIVDDLSEDRRLTCAPINNIHFVYSTSAPSQLLFMVQRILHVLNNTSPGRLNFQSFLNGFAAVYNSQEYPTPNDCEFLPITTQPFRSVQKASQDLGINVKDLQKSIDRNPDMSVYLNVA